MERRWEEGTSLQGPECERRRGRGLGPQDQGLKEASEQGERGPSSQQQEWNPGLLTSFPGIWGPVGPEPVP